MSETVPPALEELQTWFAKIVTRTFRETGAHKLPLYPEALVQEIRERMAPGPHLNAEERMAIYNQQYWWRLFVLLQESFPTLVRLFGYRDFNTLIAEPYLLRYPPNHWFLPYLGNHLVQWIREEYREEDQSLVLQAAELDAAYEQLFHAGEKPIPRAEELAGKLYLQPTVALFKWRADFFSFRKKMLAESVAHWQTADLPKLDNEKGKYYLLLYRTQEGLAHEELEEAQYCLLSAFREGSLLSEACEGIDPKCGDAIGAWFKSWMEKGLFAVSCIHGTNGSGAYFTTETREIAQRPQNH